MPLPSGKIKKRALSKVGPASYNLVLSNCEHFAAWCRYGIEMSQQVEFASKCGMATVPTSVALGGLVYAKRTGGKKHQREGIVLPRMDTHSAAFDRLHDSYHQTMFDQMRGVPIEASNFVQGGNDYRHQRERIVLPRMDTNSEKSAALDRLYDSIHQTMFDQMRGVPIEASNFVQGGNDYRARCDLDPCSYSDLRRNLAYMSGWPESAVMMPIVHFPGIGFTGTSLSNCGLAMDPTWKVGATSCLKVIGQSFQVTTALQYVGAVVAVAVVGWLAYKGVCALFGK